MSRSSLITIKAPFIATVARYAYLNTLVSSFSGHLLSAEQMHGLVEESVIDTTILLRAAGLTTISMEEVENRSLEQMLIDTLLAEAQRLIRSLNGEARELLSYWLRRFEIGNLKVVVHGKLTGRSNEAIEADFINIGSMTVLSLEPLLKADDAQEMLRYLERTPYAGIAYQARSLYEQHYAQSQPNSGEHWELFLIEAATDREYYAGLDQRTRAIHDERDRHCLRPLVGNMIDQINLVWLLRYRFAYHLAPPLTYFLLPPGRYHLSSQDLLTLVRAASFEEALGKVPPSLKSLIAGAVSISEVEDRLGKHLLEITRLILIRTNFNLGRALAYLLLREKELSFIYGLIKGRLLHFAPHVIQQASSMAYL
jgi:V/A-type H+-transporting ATPase subunit C